MEEVAPYFLKVDTCREILTDGILQHSAMNIVNKFFYHSREINLDEFTCKLNYLVALSYFVFCVIFVLSG